MSIRSADACVTRSLEASTAQSVRFWELRVWRRDVGLPLPSCVMMVMVDTELCLNDCSPPNGECVDGVCECVYLLNPYNRTQTWRKWQGLDCSYRALRLLAVLRVVVRFTADVRVLCCSNSFRRGVSSDTVRRGGRPGRRCGAVASGWVGERRQRRRGRTSASATATPLTPPSRRRASGCHSSSPTLL